MKQHLDTEEGETGSKKSKIAKKNRKMMKKLSQNLTSPDELIQFYSDKKKLRNDRIMYEKEVMRDKSLNVFKTINQMKLIRDIEKALYPRYLIEKVLRDGQFMEHNRVEDVI